MGQLTDCLKATKELRKQFRKGAQISKRGDHVFDGVPGSLVVFRDTGESIIDDEYLICWSDKDGNHSVWRGKCWFKPATDYKIRKYFS